jgi:hypothetical protein
MRPEMTATAGNTREEGGPALSQGPAKLATTPVAAVLVLIAALLAVGRASARSAPAGSVAPQSTERGRTRLAA